MPARISLDDAAAALKRAARRALAAARREYPAGTMVRYRWWPRSPAEEHRVARHYVAAGGVVIIVDYPYPHADGLVVPRHVDLAKVARSGKGPAR